VVHAVLLACSLQQCVRLLQSVARGFPLVHCTPRQQQQTVLQALLLLLLCAAVRTAAAYSVHGHGFSLVLCTPHQQHVLCALLLRLCV
jgi:hypothetical protein